MTAIAGIDNRNTRFLGSYHGRAFFGMTHGTDIGKAGDNADGVGYAFPLGSGRVGGIGEAEYLSAQMNHGGLKA